MKPYLYFEERTSIFIQNLLEYFTVGNKKKDTRNDIGKVDKSVTSQASRIAESKRSTYAEAVKKHDESFMKGINEHSSLKRNNPFLYHLTKLI